MQVIWYGLLRGTRTITTWNLCGKKIFGSIWLKSRGWASNRSLWIPKENPLMILPSQCLLSRLINHRSPMFNPWRGLWSLQKIPFHLFVPSLNLLSLLQIVLLLSGRSKFPKVICLCLSASSSTSPSQTQASMKTLWGPVLRLFCGWLLDHGMCSLLYGVQSTNDYIMCHELLPQFHQIKPKELMR